MYVTTVKRFRIQKNRLQFPFKGLSIFYLSDDYDSKLKDILKDIYGIRRIIVPDLFTYYHELPQKGDVNLQDLIDNTKTRKMLSLKPEANELIKIYKSLEDSPTKYVSRLTQVKSHGKTTLYELTHAIAKLKSRYQTLRRKVDNVLKSILKLRDKSSDEKALFITITPDSAQLKESFLKSLIKDMLSDYSSLIFAFDYVILNLFDPQTKKSEFWIIRTSAYNKNNIISLFKRALNKVKLFKSLSDENDFKQLEDKALKLLKQYPDIYKLAISLKNKDLIKYKDFILNVLSDVDTITQISNKSKVKSILTLKFKQTLVPSDIDTDLDKSITDDSTLEGDSVDSDVTEVSGEVFLNIKEIEELINLIPDKLNVKTPVTPNPGLHQLSVDVEPGNVFNTLSYEEEYLKKTFDIYANFFREVHGYDVKLKNVKKVKEATAEGFNKFLELDIEIKTPSGVKTLNTVVLPDLTDGYTRLGTAEYVLLSQVFQTPIVSYKPHQVMYRNIFSTITISLIIKNRIKFFEAHVVGIKIPAIFLFLTSSCSLKETLKLFNIYDYEIQPVEDKNKALKENEYLLSGNYKLVINQKLNNIQFYLLQGFRYLKSRLKNINVPSIESFEDCNNWKAIISTLYDLRVAITFLNASKFYVDPITKNLLYEEGLPTDYNGILMELIHRAYDGKVTNLTDLSFRRIRNNEILSILTFKSLNKSIILHKGTVLGKKKDTGLKLDRKLIINNLTIGEASSGFITVNQDYNPLASVILRTRATYRGLDGPSFVSIEQRNLHPTHYCVFDPLDTTENEKAGDVQQFTISTDIKNIQGSPVIGKKDCHPFSIASSLIPFTTYNDGNRVQMAANQMKQAMPLVNNQRPLIATGFEHFVARLTSDRFVIRAKESGKVVEVNENLIKILNNKNKTDVYLLYNNYNLQTTSKPVPIVEKGENVTKDQVIAEDPSYFKNGVYSSGINAYVAFTQYFGYGIEDSIIISESFANKMRSKHIVKTEKTKALIPVGSVIKEVRTTKGSVKAGEVLFKFIPKTQEGDFEDYSIELLSPVDGEIIDIIVIVPDEKILQDYPDLNEIVKQNYNEVKVALSVKDVKIEDLPPELLRKESYVQNIENRDDLILVKYIISYEDPLKIGDKLHNRHGNKGTIGLILPDDKMPRDLNGKPFDIILNGFGILGRKNLGQIYEMWLSKVAKKIEEKIIDLAEKSKYKEIEKELVKIYDLLKLKELSNKIKAIFKNPKTYKPFVEDIVKNGFSLIIPAGAKISPQIINKVLSQYGVKKREKIFIPELKRNTEKPVLTGYLYINKLEQRVTTKFSARGIGKYDFKTMQPIGGSKGKGQRTGEFDMWALVAHSAPNVIKEILTVMSDDHESKEVVVQEILEKGESNFDGGVLKSSQIAKYYLVAAHVMDVS